MSSIVSLCDNAKVVCDKLEITHTNTNQAMETKIGMLTLDYELFKIKPEKTIAVMSNRFTTVISREMMKKLLNSIPKSWEA